MPATRELFDAEPGRVQETDHVPRRLPALGLPGRARHRPQQGRLVPRTLRYRGPDLDSATEAELVSVTARLNNILKRFGAGWALFFEAERAPANQYPGARFADPASWLVDQERYAAFSADGAHHESRYYLTFLYLPPPEREAQAERFLYERSDETAIEIEPQAQLEWFVTETDRAPSPLARPST
jgi:type IV secretory pathway VirB4 component